MVSKLSESKCKECCLLPLRLLIKMPHCTGSFINSSREYNLFFPFIFLLVLSQFLTHDKCSLNLQSWWKYFFPAFDVEIFQWFWKFKWISQTWFFFLCQTRNTFLLRQDFIWMFSNPTFCTCLNLTHSCPSAVLWLSNFSTKNIVYCGFEFLIKISIHQKVHKM